MSQKTHAVKYALNGRPINLSPGKVPQRVSDSPRYQRPTTSAAKFNTGNRKKFESILEREKLKEKTERLSYVLIFRLCQKFGSKNMAIITFFVEELLGSKTQITSDDINALEKEVWQAIRLKTEPATESNSTMSAAEKKKLAEQKAVAEEMKNKQKDSLLDGFQEGREWDLIQAYQLVTAEDEDRKAREREREKKKNFRRVLDEQISQYKELTVYDPARKDEEKYIARVMDDVGRFTEDSKLQYMMLRERNKQEEEERKRQQEYKDSLLAAEREAVRLLEEKTVREAQELIEKEKHKRHEIRMKALEDNERTKKENADQLKIRERLKAEEAAEDHRLMQEYAAKVDRDNREREQAFMKRMAENEARGSKFENEGAGMSQRLEREKEERLLILERERKEAAERAKELKKIEDFKLRMSKQTKENKEQMEMRRKESDEQRILDLRIKEEARLKAEEYQRAEVEKRRRNREAQDRYRKELDQQVSEYQAESRKSRQISQVEKEINMPTIRQVQEDSLMMSRVMHRLRHGNNKSSHSKERPKTGIM